MIDEKMKTHLMFDMETLGVTDSAVILSFGAIVYHLEDDADKTIQKLIEDNSFYCKFDVGDQVARFQRSIGPSTLDWWQNQSEEARDVLKPGKHDKTIEEFYASFKIWAASVGYDTKNGIAWQCGTIDIGWLDSMMEDIKVPSDERVINWGKVRDVRTAVDCSGTSSRLNGIPDNFREQLKIQFPEAVAHDAVADCGRQILQLRLAGVL